MNKVAAFAFVLSALSLVGCAADAVEAPENVHVASQAIIGPETPAVVAFGIDADGRLYQTVEFSKALHDDALKGTPWILSTSWHYKDSWGFVRTAASSDAVAGLKTSPAKDPSRVRATVHVSVSGKVISVVDASAQLQDNSTPPDGT